jgi:Na+-transporting NADH:ubiquinone oxidoreductase subunit F
MFKPQLYLATLAEKKIFNPKFSLLTFELSQPNEMPFEAGQYVSIQVSERGDRRSYSICSTPDVIHGFDILVDMTVPMGLGATYLNNLQFGDQVKSLGPMGRFMIVPDEPAITMIGTGSGLGPLRSMLLDLLQNQHDTREIILYWGLRHVEDLVWQDEFQQLAMAFPNFKFHPVLSKSPQEWPLCRGRVTDCLSIHNLIPGSGYYICGNQHMIDDMVALLLSRGVAPTQIHQEKFN